MTMVRCWGGHDANGIALCIMLCFLLANNIRGAIRFAIVLDKIDVMIGLQQCNHKQERESRYMMNEPASRSDLLSSRGHASSFFEFP
jgi:hypothetical protein